MIAIKHSFVLASLVVVLVVFGNPSPASAASYNLTADKETFVTGDTFTVDVKIESADVGINAAQATISFPKETVEVTEVDKSSSAFDFWLQGPSFSNETGEVTFIGGSQNGISGKALEVLRIAFKVKGAGAVGIIFTDGAVTASDGSGTNVLSAMNGLQLTSITKQDALLIKPPQIVRPAVPAEGLPIKPILTVPLYPDPGAWYADISKFIVQWDLPREVTDIATVINQQPTFDPVASEGLFNNKTFSPLADGVWYLHVRFKNSVGWGPTQHYRISIDSAPPLSFSISSSDGLTTRNVAPTIAFSTKDQPSGVSLYKIKIDGTLATTTTANTYTLLPQAAGKHTIIVQAIDLAGNTTESRTTVQIIEAPLIIIGGIAITQFWFFMSVIVAIVAGIALGWYIGLQERGQRMRRAIIAERDVQASFGIMVKELDALLKKYDDDRLTEQKAREMRVILARLRDAAEKNRQYVVQNIEEIEL